jgi:hypothetical protein
MIVKVKKLYQFFYGGIYYDPKVFVHFLFHLLIPTKPNPVTELSTQDVIEAIKDGKSFIRLGDGEVMILTGRDVYFQPTNRVLAKKFSEIITNYRTESNYIIGVPTNKIPLTESELTATERRVWRLYRTLFPLRFPFNAKYAPLTFFYVGGRFKALVEPLIKNRHVIFVSNAKVLDEALHDYATTTFSHTSFIETPAVDAFAVQAKIIAAIDEALTKKTGLSPVILFAAGPASKAWAYHYSNQGIQCLDIGHGMQLIAHNKDRSDQI